MAREARTLVYGNVQKITEIKLGCWLDFQQRKRALKALPVYFGDFLADSPNDDECFGNSGKRETICIYY
jgi:hypothetical protein